MRQGTIAWAVVTALTLAALPGMSNGSDARIAFQRNDPPAVTVMFTDGASAADLPPSRLFSAPYVTPALSPDGRTLVFSARVGDISKLFSWRLDEQNTAVGEPQPLTPQASDLTEKFPSWSPDGTRLAFLASDRAGKTTLRVMNADGSGALTLAPANYFSTPMWSPDGKQLLYSDLLAGKPVLHNITVEGGTPLPIRADSRIIAACYSPDGKQIAALLQQEDGTANLYLIPPFGIGGKAILSNITGAKSITWHAPEAITFNAAKVGAQSGKAFWTVSPSGQGLTGVTGYADPKQVSYFSLERCDLTPYVPVAVDPVAQITPPQTPPEETVDPQDLSEVVAAHAVTIMSPTREQTVQGSVPITMIARKNVASVAIIINGQFVSTIATRGQAGEVPHITYPWDTQAFTELDPAAGLPASYAEALAYPDGNYTICAQAMDDNHKPIDQHIITVTVKNQLPAQTLPGGAVALHYRMSAKMPDDYFLIRGEGRLLGASPQQATELTATLDALVKRSLVKALPDGSFGFRVDMRGPQTRSALSFGQFQVNLPEFYSSGMYSLTPQGDLTVAGAQNDKSYLPLAQITLPLPDAAVKLGARWTKPLWVVTDLLDREATSISATHTLDGIEWMDGRRALRIRSTYLLTPRIILHTSPVTTTPGLRGSRTDTPATTTAPTLPLPGVTMATTPAAVSITARRAVGVRYTWLDLDEQRILRISDTILYTIPTANLPAPTGGVAGGGTGNTAWYLVQYRYSQQADTSKKK